MWKQLSVCLMIMFSIALGVAPARANDVFVQKYWPDDGIWVHYIADVYVATIVVQVFCGFGCTTYENIIEPPPNDNWIHDTVNRRHYIDRPAVRVAMSWNGGEDVFNGNAQAIWDCEDVRADLNQEYIDMYNGVSVYDSTYYLPTCAAWGGGWKTGLGAFNTGDNATWGIMRDDYLWGFHSNIQSNYPVPIQITSAYRNPRRNANLVPNPGAPLSRHVFGDALDIKNASSPEGCISDSEWTQLRQAALTASGDSAWIEPRELDCSHLHADLRFWQ